MIAKSRRTKLLGICVIALAILPSLSFAQGPHQAVPAQGARKKNAGTNTSTVSSSSNGKLRLLTPAFVTIDSASNNSSILLQFAATKDGTYSLRAEDFRSTVTGRPLGATITFSEPPDTSAKPILTKQLKSDASWLVKADVANVWEAGESVAKLVDGQENEIGTLTAVKYRFPFAIKIDAPNPDKPELSLTRNQAATITLKNEDAFSYPVAWQLDVDGETLKGSMIELPPNGSKSIAIQPPGSWFRGPLQGIFKNEDRNGRLTLNYEAGQSAQGRFLPGKSVGVVLHLSYWPTWVPQIFGTVILLIVLIAGGVSSLFVSYGIPNRLRQVNLREQLSSLAKRISAVSTSVDSRLRVMLRAEHKSVRDLLQSQPQRVSTAQGIWKRTWRASWKAAWKAAWRAMRKGIWGIIHPVEMVPEWALPDFADTLTQCGDRVKALATRVDLAETLDRLRNTFNDVCADLPPTIIEQARSALQGAADIIRRAQLAPEGAANAQALLTKADGLMSNQWQDATFASSIASRLKRLRQLFGIGSTDQNGLTKTEVYRRFKRQLTGTFNILENADLTDATKITLEDYRFLDTETFKLELVLDYVRLYEGGDTALQGELRKREVRLLDELQRMSWEALKCARRIVHEMQTGIYTDDLKRELEALTQGGNEADGEPRGRVSIEMDRLVARQSEPLELCVQFHSGALNHAPARDEWTPIWNFVPGDFQEKWWTVWHYFEERGNNEVRVHFEDADGKPIAHNNRTLVLKKTIHVMPALRPANRERLGAEILRLSIALFVAVIALLGGARDQLTKLDMLQGLLAVFVMGFGADTIKNLVTQGPKRAGSA